VLVIPTSALRASNEASDLVLTLYADTKFLALLKSLPHVGVGLVTALLAFSLAGLRRPHVIHRARGAQSLGSSVSLSLSGGVSISTSAVFTSSVAWFGGGV
jgi:hypothetical protein